MISRPRSFASILVAAAALAAALVAAPRAAWARRPTGEPFSRTFGIGLIVGTPTGLSGEVRLGGNTSLDFALGLDAFEDEDTYLHVDYLVYLTDLASGRDLGVPIYLGVGGILYDHDRDFGDDLHIGVRVPFGIALAFRRAPVEIFFELAVRVVLVHEDDHKHDRAGLGGALGFRVYF